jgi:hypothetical protein
MARRPDAACCWLLTQTSSTDGSRVWSDQWGPRYVFSQLRARSLVWRMPPSAPSKMIARPLASNPWRSVLSCVSSASTVSACSYAAEMGRQQIRSVHEYP